MDGGQAIAEFRRLQERSRELRAKLDVRLQVTYLALDKDILVDPNEIFAIEHKLVLRDIHSAPELVDVQLDLSADLCEQVDLLVRCQILLFAADLLEQIDAVCEGWFLVRAPDASSNFFKCDFINGAEAAGNYGRLVRHYDRL